ncbi:MAG: Gfo/Idh/MocA family oxidoreductase, partial [Paracoccaceae bacterium]|nr:Gfo/Idh/MocA family oxidoreductase [Paracoccaceae bacterium]
VLCEKPLAPTASEALTVVQAELTAGRHLVTTGYMRRFDPAYLQMRNALDSGEIGDAAILHNIHRNKSAPDWFTGPMSITNSFVHEIDISRFLLRGEMVSAHVTPAPGGDPLLITMQSTDGVIVSTEVHVNAGYGYHVHAQLVGRSGTIEMAAPTEVLTNRAGQGGYGYPDDWVPRFADAYRRQMQAWVGSCASEQVVGASAWDGYIATLIAEIIVEALQEREAKELNLPARPAFYD